MAGKKKHWIQNAIKPENKGKFAAKAKAAGKSTAEYAAEKKGAPGALGKEAMFAANVAKVRPKKLSYPNSGYKD